MGSGNWELGLGIGNWDKEELLNKSLPYPLIPSRSFNGSNDTKD